MENKNLYRDKRGDLTGVIYLVVTLAALAFFILLAGFVGDTISTELKTKINSPNEEVNNAFDTTTNISKNTLSVVWYIVLVGLFFSLIVTSYFIPSHPIFAIAFVILLIVSIITSVAMSNAYQELYQVEEFATIAGTQGSVHFIMVNLPYFALIVGIISMIITYGKNKSEATIG